MNFLKTYLIILIAALQLYATSYSIMDFGAKGDKKNHDNTAIQKAIDVCTEGGGGTVYFPSGNYLIAGTIELKDNVQIYLDTGAILWESPDSSAWLKSEIKSIFYADKASHFSIIGPGTIKGNGMEDLYRRSGVKEEKPSYRVDVMKFRDCTNILIRDLTIKNSNAHSIELTRCNTIRIDAVTINNNYYRINTNGIIALSSSNIYLYNCKISAGDDCITMESISSIPCENIVITNCIFESVSCAVKIGDKSFSDFRNIHINNSTIRNSGIGIGISIRDGACLEGLTVCDISIETNSPELHTKLNTQRSPLLIDIGKRFEDSPTGKIIDAEFSNIRISSDTGILIQGTAESMIENITLSNISFRVSGVQPFSKRQKWINSSLFQKTPEDTLYIRKPSYITAAYVNGLHADNLSVILSDNITAQNSHSAFSGYYLRNSVLREIMRITPAKIDAPLITLGNCRDLLVGNSLIEETSPVFMEIEGKDSKDIMLNMPRLKKIKNKIIFSDKAPMRALLR